MNKNSGLYKKIRNFPQLSICLGLIVLFVVVALLSEDFMTVKNIMNILRQTSSTMIVAVGMTFVLIIGGIDLSVGSVAGLASTMSVAFMVNYGFSVPLAFVLGILIGVVCGFVNGLVISKMRLPDFIVTLAMMSSARGLILVYTKGKSISGLPNSAIFFGQGYVGSVVPVPVIIMIIILVAAGLLISKTVFSRHAFAVGGNEECAKLTGIKTDRIKILVYTLSGFCASISGMILAMRLASGQPTLASGLEMDAIAACVLGGTSLAGGKGYLIGTIIGSIFLTTLGNGLNMVGVSSYMQQALKGIIIIAAVCMYEKKK